MRDRGDTFGESMPFAVNRERLREERYTGRDACAKVVRRLADVVVDARLDRELHGFETLGERELGRVECDPVDGLAVAHDRHGRCQEASVLADVLMQDSARERVGNAEGRLPLSAAAGRMRGGAGAVSP
jgi:hypothetical protein